MRRRSWQRSASHGHVELNVIPLIDVVFFLLVFYVISTSFMHESAVSIDRPESSQSTAMEHGFVPVAVSKTGAIQLGSQIVDLTTLPTELAGAMNSANTQHVVVIADREVPTGLLLQVMDACHAGGAVAVDVAADQLKEH